MGGPYRFGKMPVKVLPRAGTYKFKGPKKGSGYKQIHSFPQLPKMGPDNTETLMARLSCPERLQIAFNPIMAENSGPAISTPLCDQIQ